MKKSILVYILCAFLCAAILSSCGGPAYTPSESVTSDERIDATPVEPVTLPDHTGEIASLLDGEATPTQDLTFVSGKDGVTVTGYTGKGDKIKIPASINGSAVVAIGDGAFRDMKALKALSIPASVTSIGKEILSGCISLAALETPVFGTNGEGQSFLGTLFGADRFEDNPLDIPASLSHLRICGSMEVLPAYALYDCNDLVTLTLPKTLSRLEKFSISKCASLEVIEGLDQIVSIGEHGMSYCTSLKSVTFGTGLERVGFAAFEGCSAIREMTLPFIGATETEHTYLGYVFGARYADFSKGYYPTALLRVTLLSGCRMLGTNAFYECVTLKEVCLPDTLEEIGIRAFYKCTSLYQVSLPDAVKTVRDNAFLACDGLVAVDFGKGLTALGVNAFMNCDSLQKISLPTTLVSLPASAFAGCIALEEVDLGGVTSVGAEAFRNCNAVKAVHASGTVRFDAGNEHIKSMLNSK